MLLWLLWHIKYHHSEKYNVKICQNDVQFLKLSKTSQGLLKSNKDSFLYKIFIVLTSFMSDSYYRFCLFPKTLSALFSSVNF